MFFEFLLLIVIVVLYKHLQRVQKKREAELFAKHRESVDNYSLHLHALFEKEYPDLFTLEDIHKITDFILDKQKAYDELKEIADYLQKHAGEKDMGR